MLRLAALEAFKAFMIHYFPQRVLMITARDEGSEEGDLKLPWLDYERRREAEGLRPYLLRLVLVREHVYLHQMWAPDVGPLHNHPANAFSFVLTKYYLEQLVGREKWRYAGSARFISRDTFHKILIHPDHYGKVWTFFIFGRRDPRQPHDRSGWGFLPRCQEHYRPAHA